MTNFIRILVLALVLAVPTSAYAGDDAAAQAFFEKGAALYFEGKYAEALVQFKKGHAEVPAALFQYNIAVCNLRLERYREALAAAREARSMGGLEGKDAAQNDARIAAIPRLQNAHAIVQELTAVAAKTLDDTPVETAEVVEPPPAVEPKPRFGAIGWAGVGAATVGAGLAVGALVVELSLQPKWDDYNAAADAGDSTRYSELKSEIESGQTTGRILLFSGIGLAAVGAALIVFDLVTPGDEGAQAGFIVLPDGGVGGTVSVRF